MVSEEDDELHRRVNRLEALVAALVVSDVGDDRDAIFILRRLLRDSDFEDSSRFTYFLSDLLSSRVRKAPPRSQSLLRRVDELDEKNFHLSRRIDDIASLNKEESLASRFEQLSNTLDQLTKEARTIRQEVYENFVIGTMGLDHTKVTQTRYAPVRVYISEDNTNLVELVERAVKNYIDHLGFTPSMEYPPEKGSWYRKWIAKSKDALTSVQTEDAFKKGKRAIELTAIDKKRAEINKDNALAAGEFIKSIETVPNVVAQFGSLLIVKTTNPGGECSVLTRILSEREMEYIENNQDIMKDVGIVLDRLTELSVDRQSTIKLERKKKP